MSTTEPAPPQISIIVPARNEESCLADCLQSLASQTGVSFEIIVVDDHSTDHTRAIALSFPKVHVVEANPLLEGWTGKNNAVTTGAAQARGEWLLFTDADTIHLPGSLASALQEAHDNDAELLSYSPEQIAVTFWEMATLPVVFAELARQYSPSRVSDPASPIAAANGQYILIRRDTYDAVGGHGAIAGDILEDVALARNVKSSGRKIRFRYGANAVRTRMYRNYSQLRDGWTKNLALLFPNPGWLAAKTLLMWGLGWGLMLWPAVMFLGDTIAGQLAPLARLHHIFLTLAGLTRHWWWSAVAGVAFVYNFGRLRRANFDLAMEWPGALFGMPMFAYLLLRSKKAHADHKVSWKGRTYGSDHAAVNQLSDRAPTTAGRLL
jgi:glycosyltransferase involved in cell wall biosynthesis